MLPSPNDGPSIDTYILIYTRAETTDFISTKRNNVHYGASCGDSVWWMQQSVLALCSPAAVSRVCCSASSALLATNHSTYTHTHTQCAPGSVHLATNRSTYTNAHTVCTVAQTILLTHTVCTALNPEKRGALRERRQPCNILRLRGSLNHYGTVIYDVNDGLS